MYLVGNSERHFNSNHPIVPNSSFLGVATGLYDGDLLLDHRRHGCVHHAESGNCAIRVPLCLHVDQ